MVGYCSGEMENPSYQQVCSGMTGNAEAVHFRMHDPTQKNRQGNDHGSQYRSGIFYTTDDQKERAQKCLDLAQTHYGKTRIQTTIEPMGTFWKAEGYHQDYLTANPNGYECPTHFERSWERIEGLFGGKRTEL
ncbi:peptide methionine sulfoxide reductase MsrA [Chytridium lagenaria]|nr:peptide methionine sulfoxide reductase MsrA [Chytridium lagenaria]